MPSTSLDILLRLKDSLSKGIDKVRGKFKIFNKDMTSGMKKNNAGLKEFSSNWKETALQIGATLLVIRQVGRSVGTFIDAASTVQQLNLRLQQMLGNVEEANELFSDMRTLVSKAPVEFESVMKSVTNLSAVTKNGADEIRKLVPIIMDISASFGISVEDTTSQFIRLMSAGAAAADMFRERGVLAALGFQAGVSVSAEETISSIVKQWDEGTNKMVGAIDKLSETWEGAMAEMGDAWFNFRAEVGKAFIESEAGEKSLDFITQSLNEAGFFAKQFFEEMDSGITLMDRMLAPLEKMITGQSILTTKLRNNRVIQDLFNQTLETTVVTAESLEPKFEVIGESIQKEIDKLKRFQENMSKIIIKSVNSWADAVGKGFADMLFEGKSFTESMVSAFKNMAAQFVAAVTAMIAKWLAFLALRKIGSAFGWFGFHDGGEIPSFHSGGAIKAHSGLAVDEVPIIAQSGEGILSRRGMANIGGAKSLNALNSGEQVSSGAGEVTINVYYPRMTSKESVSEMAQTLGFEISKQLRYAGGI